MNTEEKVKHTPGPWVLDGYNLAAILKCTAERGSQNAKHTCGDYDTIAKAEGDNWKANACLIAAAPELLEHLILLSSKLLVHEKGIPSDENYQASLVIAKAEGKD